MELDVIGCGSASESLKDPHDHIICIMTVVNCSDPYAQSNDSQQSRTQLLHSESSFALMRFLLAEDICDYQREKTTGQTF